MTTQAVNAAVSTRSNGWTFAATATDGQWNVLIDDLSNSNLGILIPGQRIDNVLSNYTGGIGAVRIQDAITLAVKYRGFASAAGYSNYESQMMPPLQISPNDQLQMYTQPVDATANETNGLAWVTTNKGQQELFQVLGSIDNADTELTTAINGQSLGDVFFGTTINTINVQLEDGASLSNVTIIDSQGGTVMTLYGGQRGITAGSSGMQNLYSNGVFRGLSIAVGKGWKIQVKTVTA